MSIGYNDILNKKGKKKFDSYAFSASSLLGWNGFHMDFIIRLQLEFCYHQSFLRIPLVLMVLKVLSCV